MALDRKRSSRKSGRHPRSGTSGVREREAPRSPPSTAAKCKTYCKNFLAFLFSHVGLCALVVGYAIGGALVFKHIESDTEDKAIASRNMEVASMRNQTLRDLWNITTSLNVFEKDTWSRSVEARVRLYQDDLYGQVTNGYDGKSNQQWTFSGAFLYCLTVITTIGYGHIAPKTEKGKIATILYAILGIPLMLLYLTNIGGILAKTFRYIYGRFCSCKHSQKEKHAMLMRSRSMRYKQRLRGAPGVAVGGGRGRGADEPPVGPGPFGLVAGASSASVPNSPVGTFSRPPQGGRHQGATLGPIDPSGGGGGGGEPSSGKLGRSSTDPTFGGMESSGMNESEGGIEEAIEEKSPKSAEKVHVPISLSLMILITYVSGGGKLFSMWEQWDYLAGSYFCFISLSTIGFGDLVPGQETLGQEGGDQKRLVLCSLYLLAGLALIAMCFNLMQEEVIHKVRSLMKRIGIIKDPESEGDYDDELDVP